MAEQLESSGAVLLGRTLKLAGEAVAPGASLLLEGKVAAGATHLIGAAFARMAFGPIGHLLVAANSYTTSVTGRSLLSTLVGEMNTLTHTPATAVATPAPAVDKK